MLPRLHSSWLAWGLFTACLPLFAVTVAVNTARGEPYGPMVVAFLATPGVGALIASRQPNNAIGWLLLATGVGLGVTAAGSEYAALSETDSLPLGVELGWFSNAFFIPVLVIGAILVPMLFPDGRLLSSRWRPALLLVAVATLLSTAGYAFKPGALELEGVQSNNPVGIEGAEWILGIGLVLLSCATFLAGMTIVLRYRRSSGPVRKQLQLFAMATSSMAAALSVVAATAAFGGSLLAVEFAAYFLLFFVLPASIGVAILRYRLWDLDLVVRRSVVYGTLWLLIAAIYVGAALILGLAASERVPVWLAIAVTVLATLLFQPARHWLERGADRWVFGKREQPLKAVHSFGEMLGSAEHPSDIASHLASIAVLAAPLAWIRVDITGSAGVESGIHRDFPESGFPIMLGKDCLGEIRCQPLPGSSLKEDESALLAALVTQAGIAASHAQLASRIVRAQEAERRRIERNIHDGAQQELVALVAKLGLAQRQNGQLDHGRFLAQLQEETRAILSNLRELAQGVYPSVLADGGLVAAVEDRCSRLPVSVDLRVSPELRTERLEEEVEGAAYFVVTEGLTNLLRHSGADAATVRLTIDGGRLRIEITDHGSGFDPESLSREGGLKGLSDRLQAVRGWLTVESSPGKGTTLRAHLPLRVRAQT